MELIKNILFDLLVISGLTAIILTVMWWILELLDGFLKLSKYIIMYQEYKRNKELYDLKNKIVISKDGKVSYSCCDGNLDEQEKILNEAINQTKERKDFERNIQDNLQKRAEAHNSQKRAIRS